MQMLSLLSCITFILAFYSICVHVGIYRQSPLRRIPGASKDTWRTSASFEHRLFTQVLAAETWNYSRLYELQYPVCRNSLFTRLVSAVSIKHHLWLAN